MFDLLPVAIYTTDAKGYLTYYNKAAIALWGREPVLGQEQWNGAVRILHPDGETVADPSNCPMAVMLKEKVGQKGLEIIIERPDGTRRNVIPNPELLYNDEGQVIGGINTLIDITDNTAGEETRARFEAIIRSSEDGIISKNLKGFVTSWNESAQRIFGYTEEEMIGRHISTLIPPERMEEEAYIINRIRSGHRVETFETKRVAKSGEVLDISLSISPIKNKKGLIIGASKIVRDITRQKRLQQQIADSELLFKTITNASPTALWLTDKNKHNIFISETWLKWTGKSFEDQIERGWLNEIFEDDRQMVFGQFLDAFENKQPFVTEFRLPQTKGNQRWCITEGRPYYDLDGQFAGYAGSITDISQIREIEKRKDDFIKMASHELKTPITSVNGYVQLLINIFDEHEEEKLQAARPTVKASLATISRQVAKLTRLISELLDLTRIESGKLELNRSEFRIDELVEEAVEEARHTTSKHAILFNNEFHGCVTADRDRISQVISNLLNNAIKYSRDADSVEVSVDNENDHAVIRITDFGIGIAPADQQRIFERFYRVEGRSEQTYPGFGIGLFIANEIVTRHGGFIDVISEKGKGATFTIKLPLSTLTNNKTNATSRYSGIGSG
jgi:PAS domain S-box-containing protein